jgi:energy-coupling factor transport system ATP-binding protein
LIQVDGLGFRYPGRRLPALRDVSFRIERGESLLVLGPSGCGKSTLALCLNGAIPHFVEGELSGRVSVGGVDSRNASMAELSQRVGLVFQDPEAQFCMLKVDEEVAFGLENLAVPPVDMPARISAALAAVGLQGRERDRIEHLSGGQKQRLALACVLAQRPEVLIFDEPTAQLDPHAAAEVVDLLGELRARGEHTLIIVEHRLDELMHLVDKVLVLGQDGCVVAFGPAREVMRAWCAWLIQAGVWVPQVSELATQLAHRGVDLQSFPLTVNEAAAVLRPHVAPVRLVWGPNDLPESPADAAALWTRSLTWTFPGSASPTLDHVSVALRAGEITAIAGANGAGKSTLARSLVRILQPPPGSVWLAGRDLLHFSLAEVSRRVGYVFQYPEHQFIGRTVLEDVAFGLRRTGTAGTDAEARARQMLARFGLERLAMASPYTLSHGEQRRLSVAALLVLGQELLLLDEPTFGQDRCNYQELLEELRSLAAEGRGIVAITHDMRLVAERADRAVVLAEGQVLFDGLPAALFADPALLARACLAVPPMLQLTARLGLPPMARLDDVALYFPTRARALVTVDRSRGGL